MCATYTYKLMCRCHYVQVHFKTMLKFIAQYAERALTFLKRNWSKSIFHLEWSSSSTTNEMYVIVRDVTCREKRIHFGHEKSEKLIDASF